MTLSTQAKAALPSGSEAYVSAGTGWMAEGLDGLGAGEWVQAVESGLRVPLSTRHAVGLGARAVESGRLLAGHAHVLFGVEQWAFSDHWLPWIRGGALFGTARRDGERGHEAYVAMNLGIGIMGRNSWTRVSLGADLSIGLAPASGLALVWIDLAAIWQ